MAVNLIDNEEIHVNQDGSDITLEIQADALKNKDVVVGSIRTKNRFDKSIVSTVKTFNSSGDIIALTEGFVQEIYIPVKSLTKYTLSTNGDYTGTTNYRLIFCEYNSSKGFIQRDIAFSGTSYTITTTANTKYIRIGGNTVFIDALQLEEGDTATAYSPYQQLEVEDTGWINIQFTSDDWKERGSDGYAPKYRILNNVLYLQGQFATKQTLSAGTHVINTTNLPMPKHQYSFSSVGFGGEVFTGWIIGNAISIRTFTNSYSDSIGVAIDGCYPLN